MRYEIPGSDRIYITDDLTFEYRDGTSCNLPEPDDDSVEIVLFGKTTSQFKLWLYGIAYCGIDDLERQNDVSFGSIANKTSGFKLFVIQRRMWWYDKRQKYAISGRYPTIAVSADGDCLNAITGKRLTKSASGYSDVRKAVSPPKNATGTAANTSSVPVARAVAYAWVRNPLPTLADTVNHIDGNPGNDVCSNLEWITTQGNNAHAVRIGLRGDCIKCRVRNKESGEVRSFPSISEAVRFMGIGDNTFSADTFSNRRVDNLISGIYEFRHIEDHRPWFYEGADEYHGIGGRYVITLLRNGKRVKYSGFKQLVKDFKLWNMHLHGGLNITAVLGRLVKENSDIKVLDVVDQSPLDVVQVLDVTTGAVTEFPSKREAARRTGVDFSAVRQTCLANNGRVYKQRYVFRKKSNDPWVIGPSNTHAPKRISVHNELTRESFVCCSLHEASRRTGVERSSIRDAIRRGVGVREYTFSYLID